MQLWCDHSYLRIGILAVVSSISSLLCIQDCEASPSECDRAAFSAARAHGLPADVLLAIARVETGRGTPLAPWPWTVNLQGQGRWFETEKQARRFALKGFQSGVRSFDIGCFQINYKWHGHAFRSIEDMFDPDLGADYAARYLLQLHSEFGSWSKAAGAYHSRTPVLSQRYAARFQEVRGNLEQTQNIPDTRFPGFGAPPRALIGTAPARLGSLVTLRRTKAASSQMLIELD